MAVVIVVAVDVANAGTFRSGSFLSDNGWRRDISKHPVLIV